MVRGLGGSLNRPDLSCVVIIITLEHVIFKQISTSPYPFSLIIHFPILGLDDIGGEQSCSGERRILTRSVRQRIEVHQADASRTSAT